MQTCSCGAPAEDADFQCARCAALAVLELGPLATEAEIKDAYRVLVKVWHPDRFQGDAKLRQAADEKLKALNAAHLFLTSKAGAPSARPRRRPAAAAPQSRPQPQAPPASQGGRGRGMAKTTALLATLGVLGCGLLIAVLFFKALDSTLASDPTTGGIYSEVRAEAMGVFRETVGRIWSGAGDKLHDLVPERNTAEAATPAPVAAADSDSQGDGAGTTTPNAHRREVGAAHAAPARLLPYVTLGLTKDEVMAIEGAPTAASDDKLMYQDSEIDFADGKVSGWKIDPASAIRVKLWPTGSVDPDLDSFGVGSSKNVVLVVQGTPTAFTENTFRYGGSEVYFQEGRVVSWKVEPAWPLKTAGR
jgi:hypothetical protein